MEDFLSVAKKDYDSIFSKVEHSNSINGIDVNLRFKFIQFDPNGDPKINLLIKKIVKLFYPLLFFCTKAKNKRVANGTRKK